MLLTELSFYIPPDTKYVILETFFPANLLAKYWRNQIINNKSKQYDNKMTYANTKEHIQKTKPQ